MERPTVVVSAGLAVLLLALPGAAGSEPRVRAEPPLFGATVLAQKVHCDAIEPRERVLPGQVVRVAASERHDESLGRQIFGQLPANTTSNEAEDRSKVSIEDARECAGVDER